MSFTTINVTGTVIGPGDLPVPNATVTLTPTAVVSDGSSLIAAQAVSARTVADGSFTLAVIPNDATGLPVGGAYNVQIVDPRGSLIQAFTVQVLSADVPSVDLFSLAKLPAPPDMGSQYVSQIVAGQNTVVSPSSGTGVVTVGVTAAAVGVQSVTAGDGTITVGGTSANPSVTVTPGTFDAAGAAAAAQTNAEAASIPLTQKGAVSGVAELDASGNVPASELGHVPLPTSPDSSVTVGGTSAAPTLEVGASIQSGASKGATAQQAVIDTTAADFKMDGAAAAGSTGKLADAGHVHPTDTSRAPLASPALTGTPTVPTAAPGTNTTQAASTAFVAAASSAAQSAAEAASVALSTVTAAGDLIVGSAAGAVARLPLGTPNQVLAVNPAGTGLQYETPASGGGASQTYDATVLADKPVGYWPLNETSGTTAADKSGNGNNGVYTGAYTLGATGPCVDGETSVSFSGATGSYIAIAAAAVLNLVPPYSLECWALSPNRVLQTMLAGPTNGSKFQFAIGANGNLLCYFNGTPAQGAALQIPVSRWCHCVMVADGTDVRFYTQGVLYYAVADTFTHITTAALISIGAREDSASMTGSIAKVAMYSVALPEARIRAHYAAGIGI